MYSQSIKVSLFGFAVFSDVAIRAKPGCTQCAVLEALFDEVAAVPDLDGIHFLEVDLNRFPGGRCATIII
tara:strand:- start:934 stop:1143 length:210 start_codon:yes stop_codon:yes gene_type:complete